MNLSKNFKDSIALRIETIEMMPLVLSLRRLAESTLLIVKARTHERISIPAQVAFQIAERVTKEEVLFSE